MNFFHSFNPHPILFQYGFITVRWYGFLIALALLLGVLLAVYLGKKRGFKTDDILDFVLWAALGGIVGARIYAVFLDFSYYRENFWAIFKIWEGGLAIHGAILGGLIVLFNWSRIKKISFWSISDLLAPALALGQAIGRWGNFFNQELFGRPTDWLWGIFIAPENRPPQFFQFEYFQPAFLYESILDFILFLILFFVLVFPLLTKEGVRGRFIRPGLATLLYLAGYSVIRFLMEFVRIDKTAVFGGLRWPQWVSLVIFIVVLFLVIFKNYKSKIPNSQ
ncbi:MAG: prolipoprotein diacylglyceryl transferase [Patescibacteria group bacterium]